MKAFLKVFLFLNFFYSSGFCQEMQSNNIVCWELMDSSELSSTIGNGGNVICWTISDCFPSTSNLPCASYIGIDGLPKCDQYASGGTPIWTCPSIPAYTYCFYSTIECFWIDPCGFDRDTYANCKLRARILASSNTYCWNL